MPAPVVYLDTQDFSRFGDVLRGKSDAATEDLFRTLEERVRAGDVIFPASMPLFSELLQYHGDYRETTIRKAEAVERLCGPWALAFPTRLIAAEVASAAKQLGSLDGKGDISVLSSDRYWYPNVTDVFENLDARIREGVASEVANLQLQSRALRRGAKKLVGKFDPAEAASAAAPEFAAKYGLPVAAVRKSIVALLRGRITPHQASRLLFGAIAEPVTFVEMYFEKVETDHSSLPAWMRDFGGELERLLRGLREKLEPLLELDLARQQLVRTLANWRANLGRTILHMGDDDLREFGLDGMDLAVLEEIDGFRGAVPACQVMDHLVTAYTRQVLGQTSIPTIERSFGGDLIHALYLPHVDLWRGDRRFSTLVRTALPQYADRVVSTLADLPEILDRWHHDASAV